MINDSSLIIFYRGKFLVSNNFKYSCYVGESWTNFLSGQLNGKQLQVVRMDYPKGGQVRVELYEILDYRLYSREQLVKQLAAVTKPLKSRDKFIPMVGAADYRKMFKIAMQAIRRGDLYQINLSFPFHSQWQAPSLNYFYHYFKLFHGEFFAYLPTADGALLSFSPELFIRKRAAQVVSQPIKGTISASQEIADLEQSDKECAELSMIVDLLRNDLNIIADISAAKVTKHRALLEIGNIVHTFSEIECRSSFDISTILTALFPGGSITGCPKKRAMEYIDRVESVDRGFYTGSIGWIDGDDADFNILIRSFEYFKSGEVLYHAGGGIVVDSASESEYQEILLKAALLNE